MTRIISSTARGIGTATLLALILTPVIPQAGFAAGSDAVLWRIDPAKSTFGSGVVTLSTERVTGVNAGAGSFIVISKGNVYLVKGVADEVRNSLKQISYTNIKDGSAVLIGMKARSVDYCGFRCIQGAVESTMTVTFKTVDATGKQINDMIAFGGPSQ